MKLNGNFPDSITFVDKKGLVIEQPVEFQWKPLKSAKCSMYGHLEADCRKSGVRRE